MIHNKIIKDILVYKFKFYYTFKNKISQLPYYLLIT